MPVIKFQPTRPLRGATPSPWGWCSIWLDFNPRAPCGARRHDIAITRGPLAFQPTRPLRGATLKQCPKRHFPMKFQPTRPLRGATHDADAIRMHKTFQPTRPLRGATSCPLGWR